MGIDYTLLSPATIQDSTVLFPMKGFFFNPENIVPTDIIASQTPNFVNQDFMANFIITDLMLKTVLEQFQSRNLIMQTVTSKIIPNPYIRPKCSNFI
jgi:hypothetical protein